MIIKKKIEDFIYNDRKDLSLENRLFLSTLAVGALTSLVGAIMNFILATSSASYIVTFFLSGLIFCLYIFLRAKKDFEPYIFPIIITALISISIIWIFNGGINGSNTMAEFVILILALIIVPERKKKYVIILFLTSNLIIYLIQFFRPDLITNYNSETERWLDSFITLTYSSFFIFLIIKFLHKHYSLERRKVEETEERFRNLFNHSHDGIRISDSRGLIVDENKSMTRITGVPAESVIGKPAWDIVFQLMPLEKQTPERYNRLREMSENFVSTGIFPDTANRSEYQLRCSDGTIKDVESNYFSVRTENGFFLYSILHDITERKNVEKELVKARERAEESDQLKSAFLENISHELRTPLNAILGFSEVLSEKGVSDEDRLKYIEIIRKSTNELLTIVDNTITLAHIETNQLQINRISFKPDDLLTNLYNEYNNYKTAIGKSHINLIFDKHGLNNLYINNDYSRISQIFSVFLDNALKFTENGTISMGFFISGNMICFYIKDTGIGIHEDKQMIIFKSFTQSDKTIRQSYGGLGVGLSIASGLIQLLNGKMKMESEVNKGTEIEFSLPL